MTTLALDLRSGSLVLDDPDSLLQDHLSDLAPPARPEQRRCFTLDIRHGDLSAAPPPEAEADERDGIIHHFWRDPARRHVLIAGEAALATGPGPEAVMTVAPGSRDSARGELAMIALEEAIHASGQALIHCAALQPDGTEGLVLIHAVSGMGKTTTALALAGAGLGLAADDAVVVGAGADGAMLAWGVPRALNLHRETARMLDWLRPALPDPWPDRDEISLPQRNLPPPVRLVPQTLPVLALVELRRASEGGLLPQSPRDALTALVADNVNVSASGLWPAQEGRLDVLVSLTAQVPCHVLNVEPGPAGLQAAIRAMQSAF